MNWNGFPHFRPGTIDVRARTYDFNVQFFYPGCYFLCVSCDFYFQDEPVCQPRRLIGIYNPGCSNCLCSMGCLMPGLVDYVISNA